MPCSDNLLLASLSKSDMGLLLPHLKVVQFEQHQILFEAGDRIVTVYFPLTAIISLVVFLSSGQSVEARKTCDESRRNPACRRGRGLQRE